MGEEIEVNGPEPYFEAVTNTLQLNTDYIAGIGGICSPINGWSQLSTYSPEELDKLRELDEYLDCGGFPLLPSISAIILTSSVLLSLLF